MDLNSLQLYLFASKIRHDDPLLELHNRTYALWENVWKGELIKSNSELKQDHFLRQDIIPVIVSGETIVSLHLYTVFNLLGLYSLCNPYFVGFSQSSIDHFKSKNMHTIMAMEYLTVNPEWRRSVTGVPFAEVMIAIAGKIMKEHAIDATFGTARTDTNVRGMVEKFGGYVIESGIKRSNYDTVLMTVPNVTSQPHPEPFTAALVDRLWENRIDNTKFLENKKANRRVA